MSKRMNYFRRLIDENDPASVKRFLGLVMSFFLVVDAFVLLFTPIPNPNAILLEKAMMFAFFIVLMSLFGLAVDKVANIMLASAKAAAAAQVLTPQPTVTQVDTVEGDVNGGNIPNGTKAKNDDAYYDKLKEELKNSIGSMK